MQDIVADELKRLQNWSLIDLQKLAKGLEALLHLREGEQPLYAVREFRGIGHGTWDNVGGIDEFIRQERASWNAT